VKGNTPLANNDSLCNKSIDERTLKKLTSSNGSSLFDEKRPISRGETSNRKSSAKRENNKRLQDFRGYVKTSIEKMTFKPKSGKERRSNRGTTTSSIEEKGFEDKKTI
jgi:hypothetical protein